MRFNWNEFAFDVQASMIRVRFAPSPTGFLHLGGARTALFNFLFAKASGGRCILRLEDTDKVEWGDDHVERLVPNSYTNMVDSLSWLGIEFDESPSRGGDYGPYIQSERLRVYQHFAKKLTEVGGAYHCFCSKERLESLRSENTKFGYDGHCRHLSSREVEKNLLRGSPYTIRLKVPESGSTVLEDQVYGRIEIQNETIDDQILLKTDGSPTYHLASVVDDHTMEITHVLRGEEWLLTTSKHLLLYSALSWRSPSFAHLPLLLSRSGAKLSKRNQDTHISGYRERGFLPEAVTNFLALLGWSPPTNQEVFTCHELVETFSLSAVTRRAPTVNEDKLLWINKQHYKRKLAREKDLRQLALDLQMYLKNSMLSSHVDEEQMTVDYLERVLTILEDRISLLPLVIQEASYFWKDPDVSKELLNMTIIGDPGRVLTVVRNGLEMCDFSVDSVSTVLRRVATDLNVPYKKLMHLCRLAITGTNSSPRLGDIIHLLGRDTTLNRLLLAQKTANIRLM